jgi:hypothetical protein
LYNYFEEDLKQINLRLLLLKTLIEEGQLADLMTIIKDKGGEEGAKKWYEANKVLVDSWMK